MVWGSKSVSFSFSDLSVTGANCIKATRLCPCGYLGHYGGKCRCTPDQLARYRGRISGPLLDRIDLQIEVPAVAPHDLARNATGEASHVVRSRVDVAHCRQLERQGKPNAKLLTREIEQYCIADDAGVILLKQAISRLGMSARAYHRVLKVARTVADVAGDKSLASAHIAEAIQLRRFDRR